MTVLKRRTRIVSFRVFEEEYQALENICATKGIRSISDLARHAVCQMARAGGSTTGEPIEEELWRLKGRMEGLDRELKRLDRVIGALPLLGAASSGKIARTA